MIEMPIEGSVPCPKEQGKLTSILVCTNCDNFLSNNGYVIHCLHSPEGKTGRLGAL